MPRYPVRCKERKSALRSRKWHGEGSSRGKKEGHWERKCQGRSSKGKKVLLGEKVLGRKFQGEKECHWERKCKGGRSSKGKKVPLGKKILERKF